MLTAITSRIRAGAKRALTRAVALGGGIGLASNMLAQQAEAKRGRENDRSFLEALPDGHVVRLGEPRAEVAGVFWNALWAWAAAYPSDEPSIYRTVEYRLGERSFVMRLDLTRVPECGYYLKDPTPALTRLIAKGGRGYVDAGANVGFHALTASQTFDHVLAFEPTPSTVERLRENVRLTNAKNVDVRPVALSSDAREVTLFVDPTHHGGNTVDRGVGASFGGETVSVRTATLDEVVAQSDLEAVDLVKIDVEGHEAEVLGGAAHVLAQHRPALFIEVNSSAAMERVLDALPPGYAARDPESGLVLERGSLLKSGRPRDILFVAR